MTKLPVAPGGNVGAPCLSGDGHDYDDRVGCGDLCVFPLLRGDQGQEVQRAVHLLEQVIRRASTSLHPYRQ